MPDQTIFVFTYGNKGRGAFLITNNKGEYLHEITGVANLTNEDGTEYEAWEADWESGIKALEFINTQRNALNVDGMLNIKIFTTFEQVYRTAATITNKIQPNVQEKFLDRFNDIKASLQSKGIIGRQHNKLMAFWIPKEKEFNKMEDVISHVTSSKFKPKKP